MHQIIETKLKLANNQLELELVRLKIERIEWD